VRCLNRNKQKFYYATFVRKDEIVDEYGNKTGQYKTIYSNPVPMYANVSAARGEASTDPFGISMDYDRAIVTDNMFCPIAETSILWIDAMPTIKTDGTTDTPHDYIVKRVAKSLNCVAYAVKKVTVSS